MADITSISDISDILNKILTNVLTALYQPFWFSLLSAVLLMVLYLYAKEKSNCASHYDSESSCCHDGKSGDRSYIDKNTGRSGREEADGLSGQECDEHTAASKEASLLTGLKTVARIWKHSFLTSKTFRRLFYLSFYTVMILFRTLLNRNMWANPLSDVMGGWGLIDVNGELTTEPIENLMLFVPFSVLLMWAVFNDEGMKERILRGKSTLLHTIWLSVKTVFLFSLSIEFLQLFLRLGTWQVSDLVYNTVGGMIGGLVYWIGWRCGRSKGVRR